MSKCIKIRRKHRKLCLGDLDSEIYLVDRAIQPPVFGTVDFTEDFLGQLEDLDPTWAAVETKTGATFFDGTSTEDPVTHEIYIEYDPDITAEYWIILDVDNLATAVSNDKILDILNVEDLEERHEWLKLTCNVRGRVGKAAAQA